MTPGSIAAIVYGILAIVGGIIGYRQAGSNASLTMGIVSGLLLVASGILQAQGNAIGTWLGILVTGALIVVFGIRLSKTRKFMPAGLMLIAGAIVLVLLVR